MTEKEDISGKCPACLGDVDFNYRRNEKERFGESYNDIYSCFGCNIELRKYTIDTFNRLRLYIKK